MEESIEDPFNALATLTDPFCEFPTSDLFCPETSCPDLPEIVEGGAVGDMSTVDDAAAIGGLGLNDILEGWNNRVQADPASALLWEQSMDEAVDAGDANLSYLGSNEPSHTTFAVSGHSQPRWDAFEPIGDAHSFNGCFNVDTTVHDSTLLENANFNFLLMDVDIGDAAPEVNEKAASPSAVPDPAQDFDEMDREETDIHPSFSISTGCEPPLKGRSILRAWFESHDYPYPNPRELEELVQASGLSQKQVRTFFTNIRARSWKSTDQSQRSGLCTHAFSDMERSAAEPGLESLALWDFEARPASGIFHMQYPEADDYSEGVAAGDAEESRSFSQESSYRVEAGSKQKLSPMPSSEALPSRTDSHITSDGMPLTRRRLLTLTQKLKNEASGLPASKHLSLQRFLTEPGYAADTESIKRAIDETSVRKRICKACDRCRLKKSKCDGASPCKRCCADNATCVYGDRNNSHVTASVLEDRKVAFYQGNRTSVVRGSSLNLDWGTSSSSAPLASPTVATPPKRQPTFRLGGSSEGSSTGVRSILSSASKRSDREARYGKMFKATTFEEGEEVIVMRRSSKVVNESDSDEVFSDDAIEKDDDDDDNWGDEVDIDDWGDEIEPSGPSSVNEYELFKRVDSEPNLTSRRALLTQSISKPDLANMVSKTSEPVAIPGATSPRTTRMKIPSSQMVESLSNLCREREQKNTECGFPKRRWSSTDIKCHGHRHNSLHQQHSLGTVAKPWASHHANHMELQKGKDVLAQESSSPPAKRQKSATHLASGYSSWASIASASSYAISAMSGTSSTPGRKGKRRWPQTLQRRDFDEGKATQRAEKSKKTVYTCTFCWRSCKDRYAWSRHENTHVEPESWTCMPDGIPAVHAICVFCSYQSQPSYGGTLEQPPGSLGKCRCHQHVSSCLMKQVSQRTFSTKGGLKDHIQRMHVTKNALDNPADKARIDPLIAHWFRRKDPRELPYNALWCGFCEESFETWKARVNHVAAHFRKGYQSEPWWYWKPSPISDFTQYLNDNRSTREVSENVEGETDI